MAAGYSATPQVRKLGIKPDFRVRLDGAPDGWHLDETPPGVVLVKPRARADVIVWFVRSAAVLAKGIGAHAQAIYPDAALWIAWPRRAAGHESDVTENLLREVALPLGIVDVKVAAIDEDWSGLRFVWRLTERGQAERG